MSRCYLMARRAGYQSPQKNMGTTTSNYKKSNPHSERAIPRKSKCCIKVHYGLVEGDWKTPLSAAPYSEIEFWRKEAMLSSKSKDKDDPVRSPSSEPGHLSQKVESFEIHGLIDWVMRDRWTGVDRSGGIICNIQASGTEMV